MEEDWENSSVGNSDPTISTVYRDEFLVRTEENAHVLCTLWTTYWYRTAIYIYMVMLIAIIMYIYIHGGQSCMAIWFSKHPVSSLGIHSVTCFKDIKSQLAMGQKPSSLVLDVDPQFFLQQASLLGLRQALILLDLVQHVLHFLKDQTCWDVWDHLKLVVSDGFCRFLVNCLVSK